MLAVLDLMFVPAFWLHWTAPSVDQLLVCFVANVTCAIIDIMSKRNNHFRKPIPYPALIHLLGMMKMKFPSLFKNFSLCSSVRVLVRTVGSSLSCGLVKNRTDFVD